MKKIPLLALLLLSLAGCATKPLPPHLYTVNPNDIILRVDGTNVSFVQPDKISTKVPELKIGEVLSVLPNRDTIVVILDDFVSLDTFNDRGTVLFVQFRKLGYKNIIFLKGKPDAAPDGLEIIVEYN